MKLGKRVIKSREDAWLTRKERYGPSGQNMHLRRLRTRARHAIRETILECLLSEISAAKAELQSAMKRLKIAERIARQEHARVKN